MILLREQVRYVPENLGSFSLAGLVEQGLKGYFFGLSLVIASESEVNDNRPYAFWLRGETCYNLFRWAFFVDVGKEALIEHCIEIRNLNLPLQ